MKYFLAFLFFPLVCFSQNSCPDCHKIKTFCEQSKKESVDLLNKDFDTSHFYDPAYDLYKKHLLWWQGNCFAMESVLLEIKRLENKKTD